MEPVEANPNDRTEGMIGNLLRHAEALQLVADGLRPSHAHIDGVTDLLANDWPGGASTRAAIALALNFYTWRVLVRGEGLHHDAAVSFMVALSSRRRTHLAGRGRARLPAEFRLALARMKRETTRQPSAVPLETQPMPARPPP